VHPINIKIQDFEIFSHLYPELFEEALASVQRKSFLSNEMSTFEGGNLMTLGN